MKQFNLDEYLANPSKKVVTRDGRSVKIHCTNYIGAQHIIAQIGENEYSSSFYKDGKYNVDKSVSHLDLFFAPEKHEGWINIYRADDVKCIATDKYVYRSEIDAINGIAGNKDYIATIKIEWEE